MQPSGAERLPVGVDGRGQNAQVIMEISDRADVPVGEKRVEAGHPAGGPANIPELQRLPPLSRALASRRQ
ncbi:hypothetical protein [Streptomyces sp. NBC_01320]|uniref:hypothetical protein n=1 Tax=Streptomyces sp. NBC_01320 TaxID=2903824 RepID=UPI002E0D7D3C|nr:hypothetical protein OG395_10675 [Streptomyces sp. NBC_01320]